MTRYYKMYDDSNSYIIAIGTGYGGTEITEEEYNSLLTLIRNRPTPPSGKDYKLTTSLEWEEYDLPPVPEPSDEDEISDSEAISILLGGDVE